jgi:transposase
MCELLVGLLAVNVLGVEDGHGEALVVHIESRSFAPPCPGCGRSVWVKDRPAVELIDPPCFGRPARLVWRKHRGACRTGSCPVGSWTASDERIASARMGTTDRAGRWATEQVGRWGRTVNEVAVELG